MCILPCFSDPLYDSGDFKNDVSGYLTDGYCCVVDVDDKDDNSSRCCDLRRSNKKKQDLGFGYVGDGKKIPSKRKIEYNTVRNTKTILLIQFAFWIIFGMSLLLFPRSVMFSLLTSEEYLQENGYVATEKELLTEHQYQERVDKLTDESKEERANESMAMKALHTALTTLFGDGSTATEKEKREAERTLVESVNARAERLVSTKPPVFLTSPARMFGAACAGFAVLSYIMRSSNLYALHSQTVGVIVWYFFIMCALILSAVDREGGSESTSFMMIILFVCGIMCFLWVSLRESLQRCISIDKQNVEPKNNNNYFDSSLSDSSSDN